MKEVNEIILKTRKTINLTLLIFILISFIDWYHKLQNDRLTIWSFAGVAIGLFIINSLLKAKEWAKIIVTIACSLLIISSLLLIIAQIINGFMISALISLAIIVWAIYLIRFLNYNDRYERYSQLINSGFNDQENDVKNISDLIATERLIALNRKDFKDAMDYKFLTENLLIQENTKLPVNKISVARQNIIIETDEVDYEIEIDSNTIFFQNSFIDKLNIVLSEISNEYLISTIYPKTTAFKLETKIACLTIKEFEELKDNGMIN